MELFSRIIALTVVIVLLPVMFLISIVSLIFYGFPIFFTQKRVGYNFKIFKIFKFRTMTNEKGSIITKKNDFRITKWGSFLRKTKLDEIPQLFNIVRGDMRFIGPRPEVVEFFDERSFAFLKKIKPGISDYSSIVLRNESSILSRIGGKNPYKKLLPMKLQLASYYADNKSFILDLKLVCITIVSILVPNFALKAFILPMLKSDLPLIQKFCYKYVF